MNIWPLKSTQNRILMAIVSLKFLNPNNKDKMDGENPKIFKNVFLTFLVPNFPIQLGALNPLPEMKWPMKAAKKVPILWGLPKTMKHTFH